MSVTRFAASLAAALLLGIAVAVTVSAVVDLQRSTAIGFWGWVNGSVVGLAAFGALLAASPGPMAVRRAGAVLLSVVLGLAALALSWFVVAYRVPLWTLEGLWLWPTAIGLVTGTILALRWVGRIR